LKSGNVYRQRKEGADYAISVSVRVLLVRAFDLKNRFVAVHPQKEEKKQ